MKLFDDILKKFEIYLYFDLIKEDFSCTPSF